MKPRGSIPHLQRFPNNSYPEPYLSYSAYSHIWFKSHSNYLLFIQGLPKCIFPVRLSVKILKAFLPFSFLTSRSAYLNILNVITLTIQRMKFLIVKPSSTPHSHRFWDQIFASWFCLQCIRPCLSYNTNSNIVVLYLF